ncbi:MAG: ECF transporter S component [Erysipelotrichales bacterium]|nr:ECF transporter S component [Erysipelotrichales bacterium]
MNRQNRVSKIAGLSMLTALTIVLTYVSDYIAIGSISINLSLIPIVLAAIIYGPYAGLFMGLVNGAVVMASPYTQAFFASNAIGTVVVCLLKTAIAGFVASYIYKLLSKKNEVVGIIASSIAVPIINTSLFILGSLIFFKGGFESLVTIFVSFNFLIELAINIILAPALIRVIKVVEKKNNI